MAFCSARLHKNRALQGYGISLRYFCRQKHTLRVPSDPCHRQSVRGSAQSNLPGLRSKLAAWRRHAGSLPQAGRAQKRTVTRCKKIKFKKNQKFSKKEKRARDTKRGWVIYSFSRRNEPAVSRKGRQKASKKIKKINRSA